MRSQGLRNRQNHPRTEYEPAYLVYFGWSLPADAESPPHLFEVALDVVAVAIAVIRDALARRWWRRRRSVSSSVADEVLRGWREESPRPRPSMSSWKSPSRIETSINCPRRKKIAKENHCHQTTVVVADGVVVAVAGEKTTVQSPRTTTRYM